MKLLAPWFCCMMTSASMVVYADAQFDAYRQGQYSLALKQLTQSDHQDVWTRYYLGQMRLYGYGDLKNNLLALRDFKLAAEKGFLPAQQILARYALIAKNDPQDALYWFKKAAQNQDMNAQLYCAAAYLVGYGTPKNPDAARKYYIDAAKGGNALAQFALAENFLEGRHAENKKLGLIWLNKSVLQQNPAAQLLLGKLWAEGKIDGKDLTKAQELIGLSIKQNYTPAFYEQGLLSRQMGDYAQAKEWLVRAAERGYEKAQLALSDLFGDRKAPFYDEHTSFLWLLKAAESGIKEAQLELSRWYKNGSQTIPKDEHLASEWGLKAKTMVKEDGAKQREKVAKWLSLGQSGQFSAAYQLPGILGQWRNRLALKENNYNPAPQMEFLSRAEVFKPQFQLTLPNQISLNEFYRALVASTPMDDKEQYPIYPSHKEADYNRLHDAAELGDADAQLALGLRYQYGIGVDKSFSRAKAYYLLGSEQQDLRAKYQLGLLYIDDPLDAKDYQRGVAYITDAAFKGNPYAQYTLARLDARGYQTSTGEWWLKPDSEQSIAMYYLSSANHFGLAQYHLAETLVREKNSDNSIAAVEARTALLKRLYQGAVADGVTQAELPLAFYNAMDRDVSKQADAFRYVKQQAEQGNAQAALLLGILYDRGIGVDPSASEALAWYKKSAESPVRDFVLGTYLVHQQHDLQEGRTLLQKAADAGLGYAAYNLSILQQQQHEDFLPTLKQAYDLGNAKAGVLLADYYLSLDDNAHNMTSAREIYQHLAEKGDKTSQLKYAYMLEKGLGGAVALNDAEQWYQRAAQQNEPHAQYLLAHLYQMGWLDHQPNIELAKKWYSQAEKNYAPAAIARGFIDETVDDAYPSAEAHYSVAAAQHDPIGQYNLGLIYEEGKGRAVDAAKASAYYLKAAEVGHAQAMRQLAGLHLSGALGQVDKGAALDWYQKAATLGDADAQYQLGLLAETGAIIRLNPQQALTSYQQAAKQGHAKAMLALARMYQYGLGVPKDPQQAFQYYSQLASRGNAYAQYQLANFYYEGIGCERNPKEGKRLLQQAEDNGYSKAHPMLKGSEDQTKEHLSDSQSVELIYRDALNDWNRGDERAYKQLLSQIVKTYPDYQPAKQAYEQFMQNDHMIVGKK